MLEIYSDGKHRVVPNKISGWEVQEYQLVSKAENKHKWVPISWPVTISGALQTLARKHLCSDDCKTVADALKEIDRLSEAITAALEPHINLDVRKLG